MNEKKIKPESAIIWKLVTCQRITSKNYLTSMGQHLSPRYGQVMLVSGYPVLSAVNWSQQLPNKSRHLDELTHEPSIWQCDTGQWLSCFDSCQLTILWMANIKDMGLPRYTWDTPPFLLIVSPTLPVQSVDAYVRTYVRSVSHVTIKRKEVVHILWVWGSVPRALCAREPRYQDWWLKTILWQRY